MDRVEVRDMGGECEKGRRTVKEVGGKVEGDEWEDGGTVEKGEVRRVYYELGLYWSAGMGGGRRIWHSTGTASGEEGGLGRVGTLLRRGGGEITQGD